MIGMLTLSGCTHTQLRYSTVNQARTVADVHTQQVLDNLAKFAHDPHALPHFSYPRDGISQVTDEGGGDSQFNHNPFSWRFGFAGSRRNNESYTLIPINDPEKLTLMRCAYQRAVSGCTCSTLSLRCPDCIKRFNKFYLGATNPGKTGETTYDGKPIYRVMEGTVLIHFPPGSDRYVKVTDDDELVHYVVKDTNAAGHVVYRYVNSEAKDGQLYELIPALSNVYKLSQDYLRTPNELAVALGGRPDVECSDQEMQESDPAQPQPSSESPSAEMERADLDVADNSVGTQDSRQPELSNSRFNQLSTPNFVPDDDRFRILQFSTESTPDTQIQPFNGNLYLLEEGEDIATLNQLKPDERERRRLSIKSYGSNLYLLEDGENASDLQLMSDIDKEKRRLKISLPKPLESSDIEQQQVENSVASLTSQTGRVTVACLDDTCWFKVGSRKDVPKRTSCSLVGHYCGTYVWVPDCGRDQLTRLTLAILDIASNESPAGATTEVYAFVDASGKQATSFDEASYLAKATLPRGGSFSSILPGSPTIAEPPADGEKELLTKLRDELRLAFKRVLVRCAELDLFDLVANLDGAGENTISFVSHDYRTKTLEVRDGDQLLPLAAAILNDSDDTEFNLGEHRKQVVMAARDFLNAEARLQGLTVVTTKPTAVEPPEPRRSIPFLGGSLLNLDQQLQVIQ